MGNRNSPPAALRRHDPNLASLFEILTLPCLRCGLAGVPIAPLFLLLGNRTSTPFCRFCGVPHYLSVALESDSFVFCYQRYTLRYPLDHYDDGDAPPLVRYNAAKHASDESNGDTFSGPIVVYPRKRRFSRSEVNTIWKATRGRCHICNRHWPIAARGPHGWHIDHVIPHIGGGRDTEELSNFRVACARCNLKKGKGYTEARIRLSLRYLAEALENQSSRAQQALLRRKRAARER
jgi:5-methylcytosine-specific restriction endonuclease McrA